VKPCMQCLSSSGIVHHGGRSVAECGSMASETRDMVGLLVYITQNGDLSASFSIVAVSFLCSGISSKEVTIRLAILSARSLPLMFVCPLILCSFVGSLRSAL